MKLMTVLRILLAVLIGFPVILSVFLYFFQENLIFVKTGIDASLLRVMREKLPDSEIWLTTPDKVRLHGWYVNRTGAKPSPLIIYFGGNAEEVSGQVFEFGRLKDHAILLVNYRGYGLSEGKPSQANLFRDALFLYDLFSARPDIDKTRIVAMGRSLGSGVAVYLASQRPLKGIILVSPYDSVTGVAQKIYPLVPVSLLIKHPFDSASLAPSVKLPMLALIAAGDTTIAPSHSENLIRVWGGNVRKRILDGADHNSIDTAPGYWESMAEFLSVMNKGNP